MILTKPMTINRKGHFDKIILCHSPHRDIVKHAHVTVLTFIRRIPVYIVYTCKPRKQVLPPFQCLALALAPQTRRLPSSRPGTRTASPFSKNQTRTIKILRRVKSLLLTRFKLRSFHLLPFLNYSGESLSSPSTSSNCTSFLTKREIVINVIGIIAAAAAGAAQVRNQLQQHLHDTDSKHS